MKSRWGRKAELVLIQVRALRVSAAVDASTKGDEIMAQMHQAVRMANHQKATGRQHGMKPANQLILRIAACRLVCRPCPSAMVVTPMKLNVCAMNVKSFYEQHGSDIDFAMVDSRWPKHICKHLKPSARCAFCDGVSLCIHNKEKFRCPTCGNAMCRDPAHEIYRKGKALRKTACKGCKDAKGTKSVFEAAGGGRVRHSMKKMKHSIKKRKHSIKNKK